MDTSNIKFDELPQAMMIVLEKIKGLEYLLRELVSQKDVGEEERPMDVKEAAAYLKMSVNSLYQLTFRRQVPFHKPYGRLLFFKSELKEYVSKDYRKSVKQIYDEVNK